MLYRSTSLPIFTIKKSLLIFLLSVLAHTSLFSQRTVKGFVSDMDTKAPLIGATILQKGTPNGTISDVDGFFKITLLDDSSQVLVFSYTGYGTREATVENTKRIELKMVADYIPGCGYYYTFKFPKTEGAVKKIKPNHHPNEDFLMRLRGISSIQMRNTPLIVVDGLPQSSIYLIDPNDIASVKVLKDAAPAAKYGNLGHAGVVEIQTHRATSRRLQAFAKI